MWIIRKTYVALEFYDAFPNSYVILEKYFSPYIYNILVLLYIIKNAYSMC